MCTPYVYRALVNGEYVLCIHFSNNEMWNHINEFRQKFNTLQEYDVQTLMSNLRTQLKQAGAKSCSRNGYAGLGFQLEPGPYLKAKLEDLFEKDVFDGISVKMYRRLLNFTTPGYDISHLHEDMPLKFWINKLCLNTIYTFTILIFRSSWTFGCTLHVIFLCT